MTRLKRLIAGLDALFRNRRAEEELDAELEAFFDAAVEQKLRNGMSRAEACRAARLEIGSMAAVKEQVRDAGWESSVESSVRDLRYAGRMLRRSPGFTTAAVVTLALGIGATTTIFSFVNAVLIEPLPFADSSRLVAVEPGERFPAVTPAGFLEWQLQNRSFDDMAAFSSATFSLTGGGEPETLQAALVTVRFFDTLRVPPALGRTFLSSEGQPGLNQVAIISSRLWRRRFHSNPAIPGTIMTLDGKPVTVVGVMPDGFDFPRDVAPTAMERARAIELWTPLVLQAGDRSNAFLRVVGRLRPGVSIEQAQAEIEAIAPRVAEQLPPDRRPAGVRLVGLQRRIVQDVRVLLLVFVGAVGFLLLIACSNVANLLVARGAARQKEVALRAALGASRWRLVRQFLMESVLLASLGGAAGFVLAIQGVNALRTLIPPGSLPRIDEIVIDRRTLAFTMATSLLTGVLFGLIPALRASRTDAGSIGELGATRTPGSRFLNLLVASEVALTFVLLVGAGLLINSFWRLTSVAPGFEPERILTASVTLPESASYPASSAMTAFSSAVLERLREAPGVAHAAAINWLPLGGALITGTFRVEGVPQVPRAASMAVKPAVSPDYFRTMGIPLVRGRTFDEGDREQAPGVAIVSDQLAQLLWPGSDPIGKRLTVGFGAPQQQPWLTVVGVVGDVKQTALGDAMPPAIYVPLPQAPRPFLLRNLTFVVRAAADPASLAPVIRRRIHDVDPNLPLDRVRTMQALLGDSVSEPRFRGTVLALFAGAALVLVATGVFGVLAYAVARRTREIGLRMALGAQRTGVLRLVVGQAVRMALAGLAVGMLAALALTRLLSRFLFGVEPSDPATFVASAIVLMCSALVASYVPARRAAAVDPLTALRTE